MTGQDTNKPTHNCTSLITESVWVSWRTLGCEDAQSKSPWGIQIKAKHQNPSAVLKTQLQMRGGGRKGFPPLPARQRTRPGRLLAPKPAARKGKGCDLGVQHLQEPPGTPSTAPRVIPARLYPQALREVFPPLDFPCCSPKPNLLCPGRAALRLPLHRTGFHQPGNN